MHDVQACQVAIGCTVACMRASRERNGQAAVRCLPPLIAATFHQAFATPWNATTQAHRHNQLRTGTVVTFAGPSSSSARPHVITHCPCPQSPASNPPLRKPLCMKATGGEHVGLGLAHAYTCVDAARPCSQPPPSNTSMGGLSTRSSKRMRDAPLSASEEMW